MRTITRLFFVAWIFLPSLAGARPRIVVSDPNPKTRRCQDESVAFQANGDVVLVEYFGAWKTWPDGHRAQNGGVDGYACAMARVVRVAPDGRVVWALRADSARTSGFAPGDLPRGLLALPDGSTLLITSRVEEDERSPTTLTRISRDGSVLWSRTSGGTVGFSTARAKVGDGGELFVSFVFTNYGNEGGTFALPGGRSWRVAPYHSRSVVARLDPRTGRPLWEHAGGLESASEGEVLVSRWQRQGRRQRFTLERLTYGGEWIASVTLPWLVDESLVSSLRSQNHWIVTTEREILDEATGSVRRREGVLRIYDLSGRLVEARPVSYGARLADARPGAPIRVLGPTECVYLARDYTCESGRLEVLTLWSWDASGEVSEVVLPESRFDSEAFHALSTNDGLWLAARVYDRPASGRAGARASVAILFSSDQDRPRVREPALAAWTPHATPARGDTPAEPAF